MTEPLLLIMYNVYVYWQYVFLVKSVIITPIPFTLPSRNPVFLEMTKLLVHYVYFLTQNTFEYSLPQDTITFREPGNRYSDSA